MKTLTKIAPLAVLATLVLLVQFTNAQQPNEQNEQQKYRINIIKDDNGKQEVIDKTFDNKAEMEAYVKENKMEMPEMADMPALPAKHGGANASDKMDEAKMKKIMINETDAEGRTSLSLTYENFSPEERAQVIQTIINEKGPSPDVLVEITRQHDARWDHGNSADVNTEAKQQPAYSINEVNASANNLSDVKVFPNPSNGQFHIEFNVGKAADVQLRLTDLNGKEIYSQDFNNYSGKFEKDISNTNLSAGTYIMNIQAGNEKRTTTVVTQ